MITPIGMRAGARSVPHEGGRPALRLPRWTTNLPELYRPESKNSGSRRSLRLSNQSFTFGFYWEVAQYSTHVRVSCDTVSLASCVMCGLCVVSCSCLRRVVVSVRACVLSEVEI